MYVCAFRFVYVNVLLPTYIHAYIHTYWLNLINICSLDNEAAAGDETHERRDHHG